MIAQKRQSRPAVILLSPKGSFLEWGAGCVLYIHPNAGTYRVSASGASNYVWLAEFARPKLEGFNIPVDSEGKVDPFTDEYTAYLAAEERASRAAAGCAAAYLQEILRAAAGSVLRWDTERGCIVDELAEDEDAFAEPLLLDVTTEGEQRLRSAA